MSRFHISKSVFVEVEFFKFFSMVRKGRGFSSSGNDREMIGDEHESDSETRNDSSGSESGAKIESLWLS